MTEYGCTCVAWGLTNHRTKVVSLDCDKCYYSIKMIMDVMDLLPVYCPSCATKINWGKDLEGHHIKTGDENHPMREIAVHNHKIQFDGVVFPEEEGGANEPTKRVI